MLTPQQLAMRKSGLGGSDISAALGLSPWKTQLELWAEKCGKAGASKESAAMEWGHRLETAVFAKFAQEHPELQLTHGTGTVRHGELPYLLATPDGFIVDEYHQSGILEVKTSGQSIWDNVPVYYMLQLQHYMYVLGRTFGWFAVLFRGVEYREYGPFKLDVSEYENNILPKLAEFWQSVDENNPIFEPISLADLSFIVDLDDAAPALTAERDAMALWAEYNDLSNESKRYAKELKEIKMQLAKLMGGATKLVDHSGKTLVTQAQIKDSVIIDSKALKAERPEVFDQYSKTKKGYRTVRVYS